MADLSQIRIKDTTYDLKDRTARNGITEVVNDLPVIRSEIDNEASERGAEIAVERERIDDLFITIVDSVENSRLHDNPSAFLKKSFAWLTDGDNLQYGQQGATVTDEYIILAGNCVTSGSENTRFYLYALDKYTYEPVNIASGNPKFFKVADYSEFPSQFHANNVSWIGENNEVYVGNGGIYDHLIVFDAHTLEYKRVDHFDGTGQYAYDNKTHQWAKAYGDHGYFVIQIYDNEMNLLKTINSIKKIGTMQGLMFDDGIVYIPTSMDSQYTDVAEFIDSENILVIDQNGTVIRSWWFPNTIVEIEDLGLIDDGHMMIATNRAQKVNIYEMPLKGQKDISALQSIDAIGASYFVDDFSFGSVDKDVVPVLFTPEAVSATSFTLTNTRAIKYGHLVIVILEGTLLSALKSWQTVATGLPKTFLATIAYNLVANSGGMLRVRVTGDGELQIAVMTVASANESVGTAFSYICT